MLTTARLTSVPERIQVVPYDGKVRSNVLPLLGGTCQFGRMPYRRESSCDKVAYARSAFAVIRSSTRVAVSYSSPEIPSLKRCRDALTCKQSC